MRRLQPVNFYIPILMLLLSVIACTIPGLPPTTQPPPVITNTPEPDTPTPPVTEMATDEPVTETPAEPPITETPTATATAEAPITETPTATATATPTATATIVAGIPLGDGTADNGEVLFIRGGDLFAMGTGGSNLRRLFDRAGDPSVDAISVSPDGENLAFLLGQQTLVILDLTDGTSFRQTNRFTATVAPLLWSPDSEHLYYQRVVGANERIQLWETVPNPNSQGALIIDEAITPTFNMQLEYALDNDSIIVLIGETLEDGEEFILNTFTGDLFPVGENLGTWDVISTPPTGLFFDRSLLLEDSQPILIGEFDNVFGSFNVDRLTPDNEGFVYRDVKFAPDDFLAAALRDDTSSNTLLVSVNPGIVNGGITELDTDPALRDAAYSWTADGIALVVERQSSTGQSSLWLVPIDGSAATEITEGRAPVVVGGR